MFYQNDAYGKAGLDGVKLALAAQNKAPVAVATVERNSVNVEPAVRTLTAAAPDAIVQISAYTACAAFIRQAKAAGYGGTFFNVSFVGTKALADALGPIGAGVAVTQVVPSPYSSSTVIAREFLQAVKASGGGYEANFSSMEGYLAAQVIAEGLSRAGARPTREGLIAGLESLGRQSIGNFNLTLSPTEHAASTFVELSMLTGDGHVRT